MSIKQIKIILYIIILFFLFPRSAHAYLDPGTGSYFFQILIAGLLGGLFFIKTGFRKMKNFLKWKKEKKDNKSDGHK